MGYQSILDAVRSWPITDQLRLVHEIQDGLPVLENDFDLSENEQNELERRIALMDANPASGISFEDMLAKARARHGR